LQFGFDRRDGKNFVSVPATEATSGTNAGFAGRWVFATILPKSQGSKLTFQSHVLL